MTEPLMYSKPTANRTDAVHCYAYQSYWFIEWNRLNICFVIYGLVYCCRAYERIALRRAHPAKRDNYRYVGLQRADH